MPSYQYLAHRRNARAAAKNKQLKPAKNADLLKRAQEDFGFFCEYVADKPPAAHHKEWHKHFVTEENSSCLVRIAGPNIDLLGPRGSSKSTVTGLFAAWAIGIHTHAGLPLQILYISYTVDISRAKSATIKKIIESKRYQEVFPKVRLLKNATSNEYWSIDHKFAGIDITGEEQFTLCAAGLKGSVTSKRSHLCLTGDALVYTDRGNVPIASIYAEPSKYKIATRNHKTDKIDWCGVGAVTRRRTKGVVEITTASGNSISATPEHPFITSEGRQKRAGDLNKGDSLVSVSPWNSDQSMLGMWRQEETIATHMRKVPPKNTKVFCKPWLSCLSRNFFFDDREVESVFAQKTICRPLQSSLCGFFTENFKDKDLSILQQNIQTEQQTKKVLLSRLCGQPSFTENAGRWQQQLSARLSDNYLQKTKTTGAYSRSFCLRRMWYKGEETTVKKRICAYQSMCASHRSSENKQYPAKFNHIVSPVSCGSSPNNGQSWQAEPVSRVEFFSNREEYVYDLEVEHESHNFIANGLNVANCLLDDVVKSSVDIANPDIRKQMQENWNAVIAPTMFEGGRAICLGTRFRHDDIHATTFNEQNKWRQVVLSAIQHDPKTGDEISYWPEMWSLEYLKEKKRQAPIAFSFQYMNQIVRQSELSLAPELIVKAEIATEFDTLGVGVDLSAGIREKNDYTVMVLGGRIDDRIHIIDYRRIRVMGNLEKLDELKELLNDWSILGKDDNGVYYPTYSTCDIWSEAVQYQASLEADFKRICLNQEGLYNLNWHPVKGFRADKLARFRGIIGLFEDRKIIFNRFRNFTAMFEELTCFGNSSHDDTVDALVWLVNGLMRKGRLHLDF